MKNLFVLLISSLIFSNSYTQKPDEITRVFASEVDEFTENVKNIKEKYVFAYNHLSDEIDKYPYYIQLHKVDKPAAMSGIFSFLSFVGKVVAVGASLATGPAAPFIAAGTGAFALFTDEINNAWKGHWDEMEQRGKDNLAIEGLKAKEVVIDERLKLASALSRMSNTDFTQKLWKEFFAASAQGKEQLWDQLTTLNEQLREILPATEEEAVFKVYELWIKSSKGHMICHFHLDNKFKIEWSVTAVKALGGRAITSGLHRLLASSTLKKKPFDLKINKIIFFTYPTSSGKRKVKSAFVASNNIVPYSIISDPRYDSQLESDPPKNIPIHELDDPPGELFLRNYGLKVKSVHTFNGDYHVWRIKSDVINNVTPTVNKNTFEQVTDKDYFRILIDVK